MGLGQSVGLEDTRARPDQRGVACVGGGERLGGLGGLVGVEQGFAAKPVDEVGHRGVLGDAPELTGGFQRPAGALEDMSPQEARLVEVFLDLGVRIGVLMGGLMDVLVGGRGRVGQLVDAVGDQRARDPLGVVIAPLREGLLGQPQGLVVGRGDHLAVGGDLRVGKPLASQSGHARHGQSGLDLGHRCLVERTVRRRSLRLELLCEQFRYGGHGRGGKTNDAE